MLRTKSAKNFQFVLPLFSALFTVVFFLIVDFIFGSTIIKIAFGQHVDLKQKPYAEAEAGWYELKQNFAGIDQFGPLRFDVFTDAHGFRTYKQSDTSLKSVIFLGDSFTYGINGPWSETFVGMFQESSGREVLNGGVGSYSPTAYLYQYKKALKAKKLSPGHIVVIGIDISDVQDEAGIWIDGDKHPIKRPEHLAKRKTPSRAVQIRETIKNSFPLSLTLYKFFKDTSEYSLTELLNNRRSAFTWDEWKSLDAKQTYEGGYAPLGVEGGMRRVTDKVSQIAKIAKENNADVYLLGYPWPAQIHYPDRFSWTGYLQDLCTEIRCKKLVDTTPAFLEIARTHNDWYEKLYIPGDIHFNAFGNSIIAKELIKSIDPISR